METQNGFHQIRDLLVDILCWVGRHYAKDACRLACASKILNDTVKEPSVMQALNLSDFVADTTLMDRYPRFFALAISCENPQALYLHGMRTMAVGRDVEISVFFFNKASKSGIHETTLMFAICATAYDQYPDSIKLLDRIVGWKSRMQCMLEIGEAVHKTKMAMRSEGGDLLPNPFTFEDYLGCKLNHPIIGCEKCYLFLQYQLLRFEF